MDRPSPTTDLFTLIHMIATIAGICLPVLFLLLPLRGDGDEPDDRPLFGPQPDHALDSADTGKAMVEIALIRQHSIDAGSSTRLLEGVSKLDPAASNGCWDASLLN